MNVYDAAQDILLSMQLFTSKGPGTYDARGTGTVVGIYRNSGTELAYEWPADGRAKLVRLLPHRRGALGPHRRGPREAADGDDLPLSLFVKGTFDCK